MAKSLRVLNEQQMIFYRSYENLFKPLRIEVMLVFSLAQALSMN
jgi:hypothetical protein